MLDNEMILCWGCPHDVDDHDERARCMTLTCPCGWSDRSPSDQAVTPGSRG